MIDCCRQSIDCNFPLRPFPPCLPAERAPKSSATGQRAAAHTLEASDLIGGQREVGGSRDFSICLSREPQNTPASQPLCVACFWFANSRARQLPLLLQTMISSHCVCALLLLLFSSGCFPLSTRRNTNTTPTSTNEKRTANGERRTRNNEHEKRERLTQRAHW